MMDLKQENVDKCSEWSIMISGLSTPTKASVRALPRSGMHMSESLRARRAPTGPLQKKGTTGKLISSYYLEIDYLLERVASSKTHYQALGLERSATTEEIVRAYHQAVKLLHHPNRKIQVSLPEDMRERIDQIFDKASEAFFILTDSRKRTDYDRSLVRKPRATPAGAPREPQEISTSGKLRAAREEKTPERVALVENAEAARQTSTGNQPFERRRTERVKLSLPAFVVGYDRAGGKWKDTAKTIDVSRAGGSIAMNCRPKHAQILHLRLPMPVKLRAHGFSEPGYSVYAIVRRVELPLGGAWVVGLEFFGEQPPPGFLEKPWASFRSMEWTGRDRRLEPRQVRSDPVLVEYLDESMRLVKEEEAAMENVSDSGMRIVVKAAPPEFDLVKVGDIGNSFKSMSAVRDRFVGHDGLERLCLKLIGNKWPF